MKETKFQMTAKSLPPQVGWMEATLPQNVISRLQEYIETAKKNPSIASGSLAGNISNSLFLKDEDNWFFKTILVPLINEFTKYYPYNAGRYIVEKKKQQAGIENNTPYCLNSLWVNFQKQHEFNPVHDHTGIFSFVIWMKIPTDFREQHKLPNIANSVLPQASDFKFTYLDMFGSVSEYHYKMHKESEGRMLFFPAQLKHSVNPFYNCDEERISISGNILFGNNQ